MLVLILTKNSKDKKRLILEEEDDEILERAELPADAFSIKLLVVASSLVNLRGKQVLTVRTSKTSPRNSNGMQLYDEASTGPKPSPDTRTLK